MARLLVLISLIGILIAGSTSGVAAQTTTTLSGNVTDAATGKPVPFANVYLKNSTQGAVSDIKGHYVLTNVPLGTVEVVSSFVGYQTTRQTLRLLTTQTQPVNFRLKPGDQTLSGITVLAKRNEKVWQRQLQQFKSQLFGEPFGSQCVLLNPDVLRFTQDVAHLKAVVTEPLQIENQALGYRLWFDLMYFDGEPRQVFYSGSVRFEEIDAKNKRQEKRFQRNRLRAYLGSTRHLLASLIANTYEQQNFLVYEELDSTQSTRELSDSVTLQRAIGNTLQPIRQPDLIRPGQLLFERTLVLPHPLIVFYTNAKSIYSPYKDARYAYTRIKLPNGPMQMLTDGSITVPNGVQMQGSLANDRLSTLLPVDWKPTQSDGDVTPNETIAQAIPTEKTPYAAEKVYLQTDRTQYVAGDTLWFTAWLVDAARHTPTAPSQTLYVDLLDSTGGVRVSQILHIDSTGQAPGSITLPALPGGTYQLLAYTNWMLNNGDDFLFRKRIRIESGTAFSVVVTAPPPADGPTLRVFPEGGNLVEGLPARIAFQALDGRGRSVAITGVLTNQKGDTLSDFQSLHRGIGTFMLTPQPGQTYRALAASANGETTSVDLPAALLTGYELAVDNLTNPRALRVLIRSNQPEMGQLTLLAHVRGLVCYQAQLDAGKASMLVAIPYDSIRQDGILHLTLFDADNQPVAERLAFIDRHRQVDIHIQTDQATYLPRQPVTLTVSVTDPSGKPVATKLALAVTDTKQALELEPDAATLRSYLLLTSDLRGHIEAPEYYFDSTEARARQYLDYVMMTHGWRRFTWKAILSDSTIQPRYAPETAIMLRGQVYYDDNNSGPLAALCPDGAGGTYLVQYPARDKVVRETALTGMFKTNRNLRPLTFRTDVRGQFTLQNLLFTDTATVIIRQPGQRPLNIDWRPPALPDFVPLPPLPNSTLDARQALVNQALERQALALQLRKNGGRLLNAVNVKSRKLDASRTDYRRQMYGTADATIVATDQLRSMPNILQMLQGQVAGVNISMNRDGSGSISIRGSHATAMIDGVIVEDQVLGTISPGDVEAIDVLKNPATFGVFGVRAPGGVVNILTRRGGSDDKKIKQMSSNVIGYAVSREFYSPHYAAETAMPTPDQRATLYWNPALQTDANGNATVTFYNSDATTTIRAVAEGISPAGLPGYGQVRYSVNK